MGGERGNKADRGLWRHVVESPGVPDKDLKKGGPNVKQKVIGVSGLCPGRVDKQGR